MRADFFAPGATPPGIQALQGATKTSTITRWTSRPPAVATIHRRGQAGPHRPRRRPTQPRSRRVSLLIRRDAVHLTPRATRRRATRRFIPVSVMSTNKLPTSPTKSRSNELPTRWITRAGGLQRRREDAASTAVSYFSREQVAADVLTQEYGKYFQMKTGTFRRPHRPNHSGVDCTVPELPLQGPKKRRVIDLRLQGQAGSRNIHSFDVIAAFEAFYNSPRPGRGLQPRLAATTPAHAGSDLCARMTGKRCRSPTRTRIARAITSATLGHEQVQAASIRGVDPKPLQQI